MRNKILILIFSLVIILLCLWSLSISRSGDSITVTSDGEVIYTTKLTDVKEPVEINSSKIGYNKIIITEKGAKVTEADCPDKLCMEQSERGIYPIVCLPHKLVIEKNK